MVVKVSRGGMPAAPAVHEAVEGFTTKEECEQADRWYRGRDQEVPREIQPPRCSSNAFPTPSTRAGRRGPSSGIYLAVSSPQPLASTPALHHCLDGIANRLATF